MESEKKWKQQLAEAEKKMQEELSKQKLDLLSEFRQEIAANNRSSQAEVAVLQRKLSKTYKTLEQSQAEKEDWKRNAEKEFCLVEERIKREKADEKLRLASLKQKQEDAEQRALALEEEIEELRIQFQSKAYSEKLDTEKLHQDIGALRSSIQNKDAQIQKLQDESKRFFKTLEEKDKQLADLRHQVEVLNTNSAYVNKDRDIEIERLKTEMQKWKKKESKYLEVAKTFSKQQEIIDSLKQQVEKQAAKMKTKTKDLSDTLEAQEEDLARLQVENERLEDLNVQIREESERITRKYKDLQEHLQEEHIRRELMKEYRQKLSSDRDELETQWHKEFLAERSRNLALQQKLLGACVSNKN